MNKFDHLKNLVVKDPNSTKVKTVRTKESKNPTGLTIRLYANGEVYPSEEAVNHFDLNYYHKDVMSGHGFDVVDSKTWLPLTDQPRMLLFGWVSKHEPKVDLFAATRHENDGTPKANVLEQGTVSTKLLNLVKEMGMWTTGVKFVDLVILTDYPVVTDNGIALIPKEVERGENKGKATYERRENETFYPVDVVTDGLNVENVEEETTAVIETTN